MKLVGNRVAVEPTTLSNRSAGGLYVPPSSEQGGVGTGTIIAIGRDVSDVQLGDKVHFNKFTSAKITIGSKEYFILKDDEILAIED